MRTLFKFAILLCVSASPLYAQNGFTTVSGAIVDPSGIPWAGGTISAQLITQGGATPSLNGQTFTATTAAGLLGPGGTFTMRLGDNGVIVPSTTTWQFTIAISPGVPAPLGKGPQFFNVTTAINCGTNTPATCTANAMTITSALAPVPALAFTVSGSTIVTTPPLTCSAGAQLFNTTLQQFIFCPVANTPVTISGMIVEAQSAKIFLDGTVTNGSATITSAGQAHFNCPSATYPCSTVAAGSDVGLKIFATNICSPAQCDFINEPGSSTILPSTQITVARIATVNSTTSVTADCAAPGNCVSPNASATNTGNAVVLYGPDSTTALNNTFATAVSSPACPAVIIPQGIYFFNLPIFATVPAATVVCNNNLIKNLASAAQYYGGGGTSILGYGGNASILTPTPDFTNPGASAGCVGGATIDETWQNWSVIGFGQNLISTTQPCGSLVLMASYHASNMTFHGWGSRTSGGNGVSFSNGFGMYSNMEIFGFGGGSACNSAGPNVFNSVNCGPGGGTGGPGSFFVTNGLTQTNNSNFVSGNNANSPQIEVANGATWISSNDVITALSINTSPSDDIKIDTGAIAYITNMDAFTANNKSNGIETVGTGQVWLAGFHHTGGAANQSVTNAGTIYDGCNNTFSSAAITNTGNWVGTCSVTGVAQTSGNWGVPAGSGAGQWGTAPSVACPLTTFSTVEQCTITVGSGTVGANPILTVTFPTSSLGPAGFPQTPSCDARMISGTAAQANFTTGTVTRLLAPFTYQGTPAASSTIVVKVSCSL